MNNLSTFVFLFNADYQAFKGFYGHKINNNFAEALVKLSIDPNETISLRMGDLLLSEYSRKLTSASKIGNSIQSSFGFDKYLYSSLLLDLTNTLSLKYHTFNSDDFIQKGFNLTNIHCITISNINHKMATKLDRLLKIQPYYLGAAEIDTGNPLHLWLFSEYLIMSCYIKNNSVFYKEEQEDFEWSIFPETYTLSVLDSFDFYDKFPKIPISKLLSDSGKNTQKIIKNKGKFGHHMKVGNALLDEVRNGKINQDFKLEIGDNEDTVIIPEGKLVGYALKLDHKDGGSKAKFFRDVLNIEAKDWKYLGEQIKLGLNDGDVCNIRIDEHGIKYYVDIIITGLNGVNSAVRTVWIIRPNESMQLVTIYPADKMNEDGTYISERPFMAIPKHIEGDEKWSELFRLANEAGEVASHRLIPTPVLIQETYLLMAEGKLGRARIYFSEKEHDFVKWLAKNKKGHFENGNYVLIKTHETQSVERAIAYVKEFSRVLRAHGINSSVDSILD